MNKLEVQRLTQERTKIMMWAEGMKLGMIDRTEFEAAALMRDLMKLADLAVLPKAKTKRRQELVIGRGTKLCNKCYKIEANCRCR